MARDHQPRSPAIFQIDDNSHFINYWGTFHLQLREAQMAPYQLVYLELLYITKFYTEKHDRNPKFKIKFPFLRKSYQLMTHLGGICPVTHCLPQQFPLQPATRSQGVVGCGWWVVGGCVPCEESCSSMTHKHLILQRHARDNGLLFFFIYLQQAKGSSTCTSYPPPFTHPSRRPWIFICSRSCSHFRYIPYTLSLFFGDRLKRTRFAISTQ